MDLDGTVYFAPTGAGVFKSNPGHATFFFPQYLVNASTDLGSQSAPGITFDSNSASHTREVLVTTNSLGTVFTVQPYLNTSTGTIDTSYVDTITISQTNIPHNGMLIGQVTRKGASAGNSGTGNLSCIVNRDSMSG